MQLISAFVVLVDLVNGWFQATHKLRYSLNFLNLSDLIISVPMVVQYFVKKAQILNLQFLRIWRFIRILRFMRIYKILQVRYLSQILENPHE